MAQIDLSRKIAVDAIEPYILRIPLRAPVKTPMGMVDSTIALLIRVTSQTGEEGWGEVWCNFPRFGAFHRAVLVKRVLEPLLKSRTFTGPRAAWDAMQATANVLRLQSGETGPFAAAIAGIDIALWDIVGKRARQPIWKLLGGNSGSVNTYASLGRSHGAGPLIEKAMARGFRGFKLRVWGDVADHIGAYVAARKQIGDDMALMADANQSWPVDRAAEWSKRFTDVRLAFLEEAIPVDAPLDAWRALARAAPTRIAGGENMLTAEMFEAAIGSGAYGVIQPDMCTWGGFSGALPMAERIIAAGLRFCPHIFSGAPGLLASAHLLAASNSPDGALEYGIEYNPARDDFVQHEIRDGRLDLGDTPGLGVEIDMQQLLRYRVATPEW